MAADVIKFIGRIPTIRSAVCLGDDGAKFTVESLPDSPDDYNAAIDLGDHYDKDLQLYIFFDKSEVADVVLFASIPRNVYSVSCGSTVRVKFDVAQPSKHAVKQLARRKGVAFRIEVCLNVDAAKKKAVDQIEKKSRQKVKLPEKRWGKFWQYLDRSTFVNHPDLADMFGRLQISLGINLAPDANPELIKKDIIRRAFGDKSRADSVSPRALREWLKNQHIHQASFVYTLITRAEAFQKSCQREEESKEAAA